MVIDWRLRLALVVGGVVLVGLAMAGAAWGRLDLDAAMQALTALGALVAGIGVAGGRGAAALLIIALPALMACGGAQRPGACRTEGAVVSSLAVGLDAAESRLDMGDPEVERAMMIARGANAAGSALVRVCEGLRDGAGWQHYVITALEAATAVAALFGAAGPGDAPDEPPAELSLAIEQLEAEAR